MTLVVYGVLTEICNGAMVRDRLVIMFNRVTIRPHLIAIVRGRVAAQLPALMLGRLVPMVMALTVRMHEQRSCVMRVAGFVRVRDRRQRQGGDTYGKAHGNRTGDDHSGFILREGPRCPQLTSLSSTPSHIPGPVYCRYVEQFG